MPSGRSVRPVKTSIKAQADAQMRLPKSNEFSGKIYEQQAQVLPIGLLRSPLPPVVATGWRGQ